MPGEQSPAVSHRLLNLAEKMHDKQYRDGYVAAHTRQMLAKQMREFRGAMPQTEFAELIHKRQTMVSRLENQTIADGLSARSLRLLANSTWLCLLDL